MIFPQLKDFCIVLTSDYHPSPAEDTPLNIQPEHTIFSFSQKAKHKRKRMKIHLKLLRDCLLCFLHIFK